MPCPYFINPPYRRLGEDRQHGWTFLTGRTNVKATFSFWNYQNLTGFYLSALPFLAIHRYQRTGGKVFKGKLLTIIELPDGGVVPYPCLQRTSGRPYQHRLMLYL